MKQDRSNPTTHAWILAGLAMMTGSGLQLAHAQDSSPALEEIIVTAQKREQRLQDVPTTVNYLSGDMLRTSAITEVNQLSGITPGIFINSDQTGRNTKIKIRGVGPDEQSNIRPSIGFFYNDIPLMTQQQGGQSVASDLDLGDVSRIEILKGPQSTLFGESVTGGAIAFYNRRPSLEDGLNGRASVNAGSHNLRQIRGSLGASITDNLAFRVAAHNNGLDDQVKNTVDNSRRELTSEGYSAQLLFEPNDKLSFILEHNRRKSEQHGGANDGMDVLNYGAQTIADAAAQDIVLTPMDPFDRKVQMVFPFDEVLENELTSLHINWDLNERWSLTSVTGYQSNKNHYYGTGPLDGYNASNGVTVGFLAQGTQEIDYTTTELRLNYAGERLNSLFGLFYSEYDSPASRGDFGYIFPGFTFPLAQYISLDSRTNSAFTHNAYTFNDTWEVVFGARYTEEKAKGKNGLLQFEGIYSGLPLDPADFPDTRSREDAWGGTLKLLYHLNDEVTFYTGVDRGFRLGGINNLGQPNYDTETALNFEVGFKGLFFDNTVRLNASGFHTTYDGYQVVSYNSDAFTFITQNADVTGEGVELELTWAPTNALELSANALYNRVEYDKYIGATCDNYQLAFGFCPNDPVAGAQDLSGRTLSAAPRTSTNFSAQYGNAINATGLEWYVRGEYSYRSSSESRTIGENGDPLLKIDSYSVINGSVGVISELGWSLVLWGKNLANEDYFTNISRQPVGSEADYVHGRIGWERSYGATLSYEF